MNQRSYCSSMATEPATALDACFGSLAHPIRRAMLEQLSHGDATVTELAKPHHVSLPAISKHLHALDEAGLVKIQPDGRMRRVHLQARPLHGAFDWLNNYRTFWEERLDRLARHLESEDVGR